MRSLYHSLQTPTATQTAMRQRALAVSGMKMVMLQSALKMAMLQRMLKIAMLQSTRVEALALRPHNHREQKQRVSKEQAGNARERAACSEDDCDEALPQCITGNEAAATVADATGKKQMFIKSLAPRDDWLHRGIMLRDMDYYHYSRYVERVEMLR